MKTTNLFKAVAFVAMTIVSVMNTEVKAQENNFITNEEVKNELVVAKTIFKQDGAQLYRHIRYEYSYDDQGKHAVTHYRVLERLGYVTLVECILETGRTHQIRVHMKHIGHILFNDERYGGHEILKGTHFAKYKQFVNNCFDTCPRQALHAMTLGFVHPVTGEEMYFTSELPDDMTRLIDKWRGYISNRELE